MYHVVKFYENSSWFRVWSQVFELVEVIWRARTIRQHEFNGIFTRVFRSNIPDFFKISHSWCTNYVDSSYKCVLKYHNYHHSKYQTLHLTSPPYEAYYQSSWKSIKVSYMYELWGEVRWSVLYFDWFIWWLLMIVRL